MNDPTIAEQATALHHEIEALEMSMGAKRPGLSGVLRRLLTGPIGRQAQREADVESATVRDAHARERARLLLEQAAQGRELGGLVAEAQAREDEACRAFEAAQRDLEAAQLRASVSATDYDLRLARVEAALRQTADPRVGDVAVLLEQIARGITDALVTTVQSQEGRPTLPETVFRAQYPANDAAERGQLAREIRIAARTVQDLALEGVSAEALTARLRAIWGELEARAAALGVRLPRFEVPAPAPAWALEERS